MKIILSLISCGLSILAFSQPVLHNNKPSVYLDSNKVELEYYLFDQNNIEKVDVIKNTSSSNSKAAGSIYIKSKNPKSLHFLSYEEIKNKYFSKITKPVLLLVNGDFIKNRTKVNIDSAYIFKVEVESGDDYEELKKIYPTLAIVNIKLKNLNNKIGERQIPLQGLPPKNLPK